ncbi:MAG: putative iron sulfur protein [Pseudonocardia sp.]|uniref:Rieske (2Fe-2S) protein n=1 Tax=Pseudonocardia sp. TaxID=60912 RepID=UPI002620CECF|nr:Rieske (2Fe-2S) protein [Pseudonocardia sp.]MCU1625173.1 putative iron sulfur protein [Pseudonocardia sp.]
MTPNTTVSRRAVLAGTGAACAAGCLAVAGCATYDSGGAPAAAPATTPATTTPATTTPAAAGATGAAPQASGGAVLASTSDIGVGAGAIFADKGVVVTQPAAGEFKAFSTTCTHQGCAVNAVTGGTINCPCHGSRFSITDGAPTAGPAKKPLPEKAITVDGESIRLA